MRLVVDIEKELNEVTDKRNEILNEIDKLTGSLNTEAADLYKKKNQLRYELNKAKEAQKVRAKKIYEKPQEVVHLEFDGCYTWRSDRNKYWELLDMFILWGAPTNCEIRGGVIK